jgi:hypothetical protein
LTRRGGRLALRRTLPGDHGSITLAYSGKQQGEFRRITALSSPASSLSSQTPLGIDARDKTVLKDNQDEHYVHV